MLTYLSKVIKSKLGKTIAASVTVTVMSALFFFLPPDIQKQFLERQGTPEVTNLVIEKCVAEEARDGQLAFHCSRIAG